MLKNNECITYIVLCHERNHNQNALENVFLGKPQKFMHIEINDSRVLQINGRKQESSKSCLIKKHLQLFRFHHQKSCKKLQ